MLQYKEKEGKMSKEARVKLIKGEKEEKPTQLFNVIVNHLSGKVEEFNDIVSIEPTGTGLLVLTSITFKMIIRVLANLEGYDFTLHIAGGTE